VERILCGDGGFGNEDCECYLLAETRAMDFH
jgi:hypothetical protein